MAYGRGFNSPRLHHSRLRMGPQKIKAPSKSTAWRFFLVRMRAQDIACSHLAHRGKPCGRVFAGRSGAVVAGRTGDAAPARRCFPTAFRLIGGARMNAAASRRFGLECASQLGDGCRSRSREMQFDSGRRDRPETRRQFHSEWNWRVFEWNQFDSGHD